jgi:PAT family beta-lactamase induction signal transducer AmpG
VTGLSQRRSRWIWLPSLYFAEGLPFVAVMTVSVIMYKRLGVSNAEAAFFTSWLYLPWVIKPLWSPIVDILKTRRFWIVAMQLLVGAGFATVALCIQADNFLRYSLAAFWLIAFSSATHDIAADGFYILALSDHEQAWFVGIRNTFYRLAMIAGQGLLVMVAGFLESETNNVHLSWSIAFCLLAGMFVLLFAWHRQVLPRPAMDIIGKAESLACRPGSFILLYCFSANNTSAKCCRFCCCIELPKRNWRSSPRHSCWMSARSVDSVWVQQKWGSYTARSVR